MAGVVPLFIFIMSYLCLIEANRLKTKLPKVSARKHGQGDSAEVPSCIPGEFYRGQNCEQCFCSDKGFEICTVPLTCKMDVKEPSRNELIHIFNPAIDLSHLPEVHDAASKCKPGKAYRMDCNRCICTRTKSLLCETLLCPSYEDVNRQRANEMSGQSCKKSDTINENCIKCSCKNGTLACDFKKDCVPPEVNISPLNKKNNRGVHTLQSTGQKCYQPGQYVYRPGKPPCYCPLRGRLQCPRYSKLNRPRRPRHGRPRPLKPELLDPRSGKKCFPGVNYINDCNRCTCSQKRLLHCTSMTCLGKNNTLARLLKRRPRPALQEKTVRPPKRHKGKKLLDAMFSDSGSEERRRSRRSLDLVQKLRIVTQGKKCEPGVMYYKQCNKCSCSQDGSLLCTTKACPSIKGDTS